MTGDNVSVERKLQRWSVNGINIPWFLFTITTLMAFMSVNIEDTNPSQFDIVFSAILIIFLSLGIVDRIRISVYLRMSGIILIGIYGSNLFISSTEMTMTAIGACFLFVTASLAIMQFISSHTV